MLWLCVFTTFQVQTDIQERSNGKTKEHREESEKFFRAPVGMLRQPASPATGRSSEVLDPSKKAKSQWSTTATHSTYYGP